MKEFLERRFPKKSGNILDVNGKIIAAQKNSVQFEVSDKLEHLYVKNGDNVHKGQLLASLSSFKYQQRLARTEIELKKAKFQF